MRLNLFTFSSIVGATLVLIFLNGCANPIIYPNQPVVEPDSRIQLNISANIPIDTRRIYIQNAMVLSKSSLDTFETYCSITMTRYQEKDAPQMQVKPGKFRVSRVRLYNDFMHYPVVYANNDDSYYRPSGGIIYRTELHLSSTDQPDIQSVNCTNRKEDFVRNGYYPQRKDFESVMGSFIDLR
jgi:hypothetical protein